MVEKTKFVSQERIEKERRINVTKVK